MPDPYRKANILLRALAVCAVGAGIGFGTCGVALLTGRVSGQVTGLIASAGAVLFAASFVAMVIIALMLLLEKFVGSAKR